MIELLLNPHFKTKIGVVTLDASISERHSKKNVITGHPIESGKDVTDHIRREPENIEINGIISNTPIFQVLRPGLGVKSPVDGDNSFLGDRASQADKAFRKTMEEGGLITVFTSLRTYKNMAISAYSVTRDKDTSNILQFTISLQEVIIVETIAIQLPTPVQPSNGPITDNGSKTSKAIESPDTPLRALIHFGSGIPHSP